MALEPKTLMERQTLSRKRPVETPGTAYSKPGGCLTVHKNPSIFRIRPEDAGENPGEYPGVGQMFSGSLMFICSRTALKEPEMDKM